MKIIEISGSSRYHLKDQWSEIRLVEAIAIASLPMPDKLQQVIKAKSEDERITKINSITHDDIINGFMTYYKEVLYLLSNIPKEDIEAIDVNELSLLYNNYLAVLVADIVMLNPTSYNAIGLKSFAHDDNNTYYLPESITIANNELLMAKENTITFSDAFDMLQGGMSLFPQLIATLCRKQGESYSEELVFTRSEAFQHLTMDIVWEVFFCLHVPLNTLGRDLRGYLAALRLHLSKKMLYANQSLTDSDLLAICTRLLNLKSVDLLTILN